MTLSRFELRVLSQNGEDGVLAEIFRRVGAPARYFVEFGIESGRQGNCVYLADLAEWTGLFIEAPPSIGSSTVNTPRPHGCSRVKRW